MDIASIIQPESGRRLYSFLSVTYGMVANLDIGTEHLRWMGGTRFIWGAIREILTQKTYSIDIQFLESKETDGDETQLDGTKLEPKHCSAHGPRLNMLQSWYEAGTPPSAFWLPGFFFTPSFCTAVLQNYARKINLAIDTIAFDFQMMDLSLIHI